MSDSQAPMVLARFPHEFQAELVVNELQRQGVHAKTTGATISGFRAEVPADVSVIVPASELNRAKQLMEKLHAEQGDDVDWSTVPIGDEPIPSQESSIDTEGGMKVGLWCFALLFICVIIAFVTALIVF